MTYTLLGIIAGIYVLQNFTIAYSGRLHHALFVIDVDWYLRPWSLITSTLAHGGISHILMNGLFLFFIAPTMERIVGAKRFAILFFVSGAIAGVAQVELSRLMGESGGALGASGALMMIFGTLMIIMPKSQILIYGIVPVPFWAAGLGYVILDIFGVFNPNDGIGNIAHLSGMAMGFIVGWRIRQDMRRRGVRLAYD